MTGGAWGNSLYRNNAYRQIRYKKRSRNYNKRVVRTNPYRISVGKRRVTKYRYKR